MASTLESRAPFDQADNRTKTSVEDTAPQNPGQQSDGKSTTWVYTPGDPESALELVDQILCETLTEVRALVAPTLLRAARYTRATIKEWEGQIMDLRCQNTALQLQVQKQ